jgi:hypothetical protein
MSFKLCLRSVPELSFSVYITDISLTITSLNTQNICFRLLKRIQMQESSQDCSSGIWCHVPIVWVTHYQIPWCHILENNSQYSKTPTLLSYMLHFLRFCILSVWSWSNAHKNSVSQILHNFR